MANQTVSTSKNFDDATISGLLNGDDISINTGATLTINSDNRWSQNAAVIGNLTISSSSGGRVLIDARDVWWVPFSGSTGNVPALGTVGTPDVTRGGSNVGEFLGVWTDLGVSPSASGGAMPASGYIKLRVKTVTFAASDILTFTGGATVTLSSAGQRGWLSVVGEYQQLITIPRLGKFEALGDWFYLDDTNGADDQQIKLPVNDVCPAVQIETSAGSEVYEWYLNAGARWATATQYVPTDLRGKYFGQASTYGTLSTTSGSPIITGFTNTDGITVGSPVIASAGFSNGSGLYVVSIVPNTSVTVSANSNSTVTGTMTLRYFKPYIELARRASNSCGYKHATGCKVRIPNIHIGTSISGWNGYILHTTSADRWEFVTTSAGEIYVDKVWSNIYFNLSAPYSVNLLNSTFGRTILISNTAADTVLNNCGYGLESTIDETPILLSNLFSGLTLTDVCAVRYSSASGGNSTFNLADIDTPIITRCCSRIFGSTTAITRGNSDARTYSLTRVNNILMTDCNSIGGKLLLTQCINGIISNTAYADQINGTTVNTNPLTAAFDIQATCIRIKANGFSNFGAIANVHPYTAIFSVTAGCADIEIYEIGTPTVKYNCGSSNATVFLVTSSVTLGLKLKRIYTENTRTSALSLANTVQNVQIDNVWCDLADSQAIPSLNTLVRGCGWTNSTTGQTSCYGRHWEDAFTSTTTGIVLLAMNEPLPATAAQAVVTSGTPKYTSVGTINMPTLGDQVVWETPSWIIGHKSFVNGAATVTGTNTGNFTLEYAFMPYGSTSYGSWKTISGANLSAETIPAFVNLYNQGGFKLKIRVTVATAATTNALTYIRINTVTDSTEYARKYPFENPSVGYTSTLSDSNLSIYTNTGDFLADTATYSAGSNLADPPWDVDYSAILRLRKPGYQPIENTITIDSDGQTIAASQVDYSTIPDTDPGALGITVTNHGASPVTWNSKDFSITITTTNDSLTATQVANYINYNISQFAIFNSFSGLAWPEMVLPDGSNFQTSRGRLFGSVGTTLKGVRVVRNDGTTAVPGFTQMQADDGTYYVSPVTVSISNMGLVSGSRVQLYNVTTSSQIENIILSGTTYSYSTISGTGITVGDSLRLRVTYQNGTSAKLEAVQTAIAAPTTTFSIVQEDDTIYSTYAIDGSLVGNFSADYANDQVDVILTSDYSMASFYAWWVFNLTTANGIANFFGAVEALDAANIKNDTDILSIKFDNTTSTYIIQTDNVRFYRGDGAYPCQRPSTGGGGIDIVWKDKVYVAETGTSGLTPSEAATLAKIDTLTEDVSGLRFTTKALETAGGSSLTVDAIADAVWNEAISGHLSAGSTGEKLNSASAPSAATVASAVRTELTTELGRIDVATSTRLASASYTAAPTAAQVRTEMDTNSTKLDVAVSSRLASVSYTTPPTAVAIRSEIDSNSTKLDVAVSTRLATAGYTSPPTVVAIRTEMDSNSTKLANLDASVSSRLSTAGYTAPDNAGIAAIPLLSEIEASTVLAKEATVAAKPTAAQIRTEMETTDSKLDKVDKKTNLIGALL